MSSEKEHYIQNILLHLKYKFEDLASPWRYENLSTMEKFMTPLRSVIYAVEIALPRCGESLSCEWSNNWINSEEGGGAVSCRLILEGVRQPKTRTPKKNQAFSL